MDPRCQHCGLKIPKSRVENARRVGRKAKYHSERCHSAAKQQRYRQKLPKIAYDNMHLRNLVAHSMIADRILRDPAVANVAKASIERWENLHGEDPALREWGDLLESGDQVAIVSALIRVDEKGLLMRCASPFGDILTYEERSLIFESNGSEASRRGTSQ